MELLVLVLLYYLSQNPDFAETAKPLMSQLKNSEQMLNFLNDLAKFSKTFTAFQSSNEQKDEKKQENYKQEKPDQKTEPPKEENQGKEKSPQSPTSGIADDFIEQILESYLKKH